MTHRTPGAIPPLPPRPLIIAAGLQIGLFGSALLAAVLALRPMAALGWRGCAVALACYALIATLVLAGLPRHAPHDRFGLANGVTLSRAAGAALLLGVIADLAFGGTLTLDPPLRWVLSLAAAIALVLDGVDGWAARRSGLASAFGARFDMETDALFALALALLVHASGKVGAWVLTSGLLRYIFVLAGWVWAPLAAPLLPSRRRKVVCVVQVAVLIAALVPVVPGETAWLLCLAGLALLAYSCGVDCLWLAGEGRRARAEQG
jgi:phosphatidylglycerophosphate synthase